jgi:hypothetical protein
MKVIVTKEILNGRKEELLQRREELLAEANAVNGALENIDWLLGVLSQETEPSQSPQTTAEIVSLSSVVTPFISSTGIKA